ncbi:hypothetical protein OOK60_15740 [Trichothermofontia sichuanensis B231]|uniref:hypothetical protein n=1 Tax=Trichothermofontia sichuanensis TaxID=3045816 RepID=UPI002247AE5A|nr:hypothetical protein [Trichothermofontia sichuanensis]UZQ53923.1 hypothetical protein OOK60_15740 [Trichothermofontia sichuanensis B231]
MAFQVLPVTTAVQMEQFLDVPAQIYHGDRNWVPPLRQSIAAQLSPQAAFRQYGELQAFIAIGEQSTLLGRIVAAVNHRLVAAEGTAIGVFGYFECVNQDEVAQALFQAASDWLKARGMTRLRGPINLSTHNDCLFLVEGFDSPPVIRMPYNPPYYPALMERAGWVKAKDAYAYELPLDKPLSPEFERAYRIACRSGVTFRPIHTKGEGFKQDCKSLYHLFNRAFANNWSSSPRTEAEFFEDAKDLQQLVDTDIFPVAEVAGEIVGFFMGLPDYNLALKHVNGKLDWWGILKFLWYRRQIDRARILVICSLPEYRRKLVPLALIYLGMQGGIRKRNPYTWAELSWVWEDNYPSRRLIEASGGQRYKTYRMYERSLVES